MASPQRANEMASGFYLRAVRLARRVRLRDIWRGTSNEGSGPSMTETANEQGQVESEGSSDEDFDPNDSDCEVEQDICAEEEERVTTLEREHTETEETKAKIPLDYDIFHSTKKEVSPNHIYPKFGRMDKNGMVSTLSMLSGREFNISKLGRWSKAECCHMAARYLPEDSPCVIDSGDSRVYVGRFSSDGSLFVGGFQERHIRIYNVDRSWSVKKDILARHLRWTVTDTALSHDQRFLVLPLQME